MQADKELAELDRQVAEALGWNVSNDTDSWKHWVDKDGDDTGLMVYIDGPNNVFSPSTNGQQAMDLVREYKISFYPRVSDNQWQATTNIGDNSLSLDGIGPTPEIAICRAVVASKENKDE